MSLSGSVRPSYSWFVLSLPFLASAAHGDTLIVRLGDLTLRPYVLLQLDEGSTFGQTRGGGQRPAGAVAQDGDRRARCRPNVVQHMAQLLYLPIGLSR